MKPISIFQKTIFLFFIVFTCFSCNVLNLEPYDEIPADDAFKNKSGIEKGILGSYSELQSLSYYGRSYLIISDLSADNLDHPFDGTSSDYSEADNNALMAENGVVDGIWSSIYSALNVVNNVIVKVPEIDDMNDDEKAAALGELYFLRALNHFNLMNYFGPIPIKTEPIVGVNNFDVPRIGTDTVFLQIINDLLLAEAGLDANTSLKNRATKYAATALLARVYLYQKDYQNAWEKANEVIENGGYTLLADFAGIFHSDGSAETIFEIDFDEMDRNRIAEQNFPKTLNGRREVEPNSDLIDLYDTNDERFATTIAYDGINAYANKYIDLNTGADNVIVLRLAEMYLIRAEAEAHLTTGTVANVQNDLNQIRNRANLGNTPADTMDELLLAIEAERQLEFAFEGHRWFDLVRTGRATEVLPNVTNINKTLFPIPISELNTNNNFRMTQNSGY